jgi:hypothetical protein
MATAQSDPTSQDLRCNKCRTSLSVSSDHVQNLEGKNLDQTLIFLREDSLPEWIELKVEEVTLTCQTLFLLTFWDGTIYQ